MAMTPPPCAHGACAATLHTRTAMARRGDRVVSYEAQLWRCDRCGDPVTGASPLEFLDAQLMRANDGTLARAWLEKFGEALPASGRPGRRTDAARTERVAVLLTPEELARVDEARGDLTRSEFVRSLVAGGLRERHAAR
jgi:hypothetical protein